MFRYSRADALFTHQFISTQRSACSGLSAAPQHIPQQDNRPVDNKTRLSLRCLISLFIIQSQQDISSLQASTLSSTTPNYFTGSASCGFECVFTCRG